jgi:hypothetical protein
MPGKNEGGKALNWIVCNYELKKGKGAKKRVSEDTSALGETKRTNPILHNFRWS